MAWSGDAHEGCRVPAERMSLDLARLGRPLAWRLLDVELEPNCMNTTDGPGAGIFAKGDVGYCLVPAEQERAAIDWEREWLAVIELPLVPDNAALGVEGVVGFGNRVRFDAVLALSQSCASSGFERKRLALAVERTVLPPGSVRIDRELMLRTARPPSCFSAAAPAPGELQVGQPITLYKGFYGETPFDARYLGPMPATPSFAGAAVTPVIAWSLDGEQGERVRMHAHYQPDTSIDPEAAPDAVYFYGPIDSGNSYWNKPLDASVSDFTITVQLPAAGRYLVVFQPALQEVVGDIDPPWLYWMSALRYDDAWSARGLQLRDPSLIAGRWRAHPTLPELVVWQQWVDAAVADVTGDGRADLVLLGGGYPFDLPGASQGIEDDRLVMVLRQQPDGSLTSAGSYAYLEDGDEPPGLVTQRLRARMTIADVDGDALADVIVAGTFGVRVMRNVGGGAFALQPAFHDREALGVTRGDFDGDGHTDVVINGRDERLEVFHGDGHGGFEHLHTFQPAGTFRNHVAVGDLDGDGKDDIIVEIPSGLPQVVQDLLVYRSGQEPADAYDFRQPNTGLPPSIESLRVGNVDGDDRIDLVVGGEVAGIQVIWILEPSANGSLTMPSNYTAWMKSAMVTPYPKLLADLDRDGRDDIFGVVGIHLAGINAISWLPSNQLPALAGRHGIVITHRHRPERMSAGDLNGDGCLDVVSTHEYGEGVTLYYGDGCAEP